MTVHLDKDLLLLGGSLLLRRDLLLKRRVSEFHELSYSVTYFARKEVVNTFTDKRFALEGVGGDLTNLLLAETSGQSGLGSLSEELVVRFLQVLGLGECFLGSNLVGLNGLVTSWSLWSSLLGLSVVFTLNLG